MSQLFFTKTAAQRLLPFASKIERIAIVNGAVNVVYIVRNRRCSTFLSKRSFYNDFLAFREAGARTVVVRPWSRATYGGHYDCFSGNSENIRVVRLIAGTVNCSCPDWERQRAELGQLATGCKHVLATLSHIGHNSIAEYMEAKKREAEAKFLAEAEAAKLSIFPY